MCMRSWETLYTYKYYTERAQNDEISQEIIFKIVRRLYYNLRGIIQPSVSQIIRKYIIVGGNVLELSSRCHCSCIAACRLSNC